MEYTEKCICEQASSFGDCCIIDGFNSSETLIKCFTAVTLGAEIFEGKVFDHIRLDAHCRRHIAAARSDSTPWGVALEDIPSGRTGMIAVSGTVPAFFSGRGKFVTPTASGLNAGKSGTALVLLDTCEHWETGNTVPGVILLNCGIGGEREYNGQFKIRAFSPTSIEIINGSSEGAYCGSTDVPGVGLIPSAVLAVLPVCTIYLSFYYDSGTRRYSAEFQALTSAPEDAVFYKVIGGFDNGAVTQYYFGDTEYGGSMRFAGDWYLV